MSRNAVLILSVSMFIAVIIAGVISEKEMFPDEESAGAKPPFEAVKEIFQAGEAAKDCGTVTEAVNALRAFLVNQEYVPAEFAPTVTLPSKKSKPTISDLAVDRTMRLQKKKEQLCSGN